MNSYSTTTKDQRTLPRITMANDNTITSIVSTLYSLINNKELKKALIIPPATLNSTRTALDYIALEQAILTAYNRHATLTDAMAAQVIKPRTQLRSVHAYLTMARVTIQMKNKARRLDEMEALAVALDLDTSMLNGNHSWWFIFMRTYRVISNPDLLVWAMFKYLDSAIWKDTPINWKEINIVDTKGQVDKEMDLSYLNILMSVQNQVILNQARKAFKELRTRRLDILNDANETISMLTWLKLYYPDIHTIVDKHEQLFKALGGNR